MKNYNTKFSWGQPRYGDLTYIYFKPFWAIVDLVVGLVGLIMIFIDWMVMNWLANFYNRLTSIFRGHIINGNVFILNSMTKEKIKYLLTLILKIIFYGFVVSFIIVMVYTNIYCQIKVDKCIEHDYGMAGSIFKIK